MAEKEVKVKVVGEADTSKIQPLEAEVNRLKQQRLQLRIETNSDTLQATTEKIEQIKSKLNEVDSLRANPNVTINEDYVNSLKRDLAQLSSERIDLEIAVRTDELSKAKLEEEALNGSAKFDIDVDDAAVQGAMQNINDGINQAKQGASELAEGVGTVLESAGRMEGTEAFLSMNMGADKAKQKLNDIRSVTDNLPGDDVVLQNLLSQAAIKQPGLVQKDFEQMGESAADYMAAMQNFGKTSTETQQDLMNYILAGNTAEVELSPILQSHIDDLKAANTPRERALALQDALKKEHWEGIASQDTYNNKLQTFTDLIERGKINFGSMFLDATKGAMGFIGDLDQATGGMLGMGAAVATELVPGLFSMGQGIFTAIPGVMQLSEKFGGLSGIMGAAGSKISGLPGILGTVGSAITGLGAGPIALIIAAIAALVFAIYEVGKAFGWWTDVSSMLDAIKTGVMELWNTFIGNTYVVQAISVIKEGLMDAWNAIQQIGQGILTAIGGGSGEFDILGMAVQALHDILNAVGPFIVQYIRQWMDNWRMLYSVGQMVWPYVAAIISNTIAVIRGIISGAMAIWTGLQNAWRNLQSTASSVFSAINGIVSGAAGVWHGFQSSVQGVIDGIMDKINQLKDAAAGIGDLISQVTGGGGGIEVPMTVSGGGGYAGYTNVSQGNTIIFNMYGDIKDEKTLDDTIDAINSRLQLEAYSNGSIDNLNGGSAI